MSDRSNTALAEAPQRAVAHRAPANDVRSTLERSKDRIAAVLPKHLSADRMLKIALVALTKNPALMKCEPLTVVRSVMTAAELGLDVGGALGSAYLVPYGRDCQLIIGYRGLIDLARRSGQIVSIVARVVYQNDDFELEYGTESPRFRHKPALDKEPGAFRLVYAIAELKGGGTQFEVMTKPEIERIRNRSRSGNNGPWKTDYEEMARKTVIRRLSKYLPISVELAEAVSREADDTIVEGHVVSGGASLNQRLQGPPAQAALPPMDEPSVDAADNFDGDVVDAQQGGDESQLPPDEQPAAPRVISADDFPQVMEGIAQDRGMTSSELSALLGKVKLNNAIAKQAVRTAVVEAFAAGKLGDDGKIVA